MVAAVRVICLDVGGESMVSHVVGGVISGVGGERVL